MDRMLVISVIITGFCCVSVITWIIQDRNLHQIEHSGDDEQISHRVKRETGHNSTNFKKRSVTRYIRMIVDNVESPGCAKGSTKSPVFNRDQRKMNGEKLPLKVKRNKAVAKRNGLSVYATAQVLFSGATPNTSYSITVNDDVIYTCPVSYQTLPDSQRGHSDADDVRGVPGVPGIYSQCNVNGLLFLNKRDRVRLTFNTEPATRVVCGEHLTFWTLTIL